MNKKLARVRRIHVQAAPLHIGENDFLFKNFPIFASGGVHIPQFNSTFQDTIHGTFCFCPLHIRVALNERYHFSLPFKCGDDMKLLGVPTNFQARFYYILAFIVMKSVTETCNFQSRVTAFDFEHDNNFYIKGSDSHWHRFIYLCVNSKPVGTPCLSLFLFTHM